MKDALKYKKKDLVWLNAMNIKQCCLNQNYKLELLAKYQIHPVVQNINLLIINHHSSSNAHLKNGLIQN